MASASTSEAATRSDAGRSSTDDAGHSVRVRGNEPFGSRAIGRARPMIRAPTMITRSRSKLAAAAAPSPRWPSPSFSPPSPRNRDAFSVEGAARAPRGIRRAAAPVTPSSSRSGSTSFHGLAISPHRELRPRPPAPQEKPITIAATATGRSMARHGPRRGDGPPGPQDAPDRPGLDRKNVCSSDPARSRPTPGASRRVRRGPAGSASRRRAARFATSRAWRTRSSSGRTAPTRSTRRASAPT